MASIMSHETGGGTSRMVRENLNPAGLMDPRTNWQTGQRFESIEEGIGSAGRTIGKNYRRAGGDINALARIYAPPGAANDRRNLNRFWPGNVSRLQEQFRDGGDGGREEAASLDRAALDRDMGREVSQKVEGTGKLTVDVNAPQGTKVAAEGDGLFKKVETNRQTQMAEARSGPEADAS
jgi:hypothetical protein